MPASTIPNFDPTPQIRRARFRWSSYWHNWSLLLTEGCDARPGYGHVVEIDLTTPSADLDRLLGVNVRRHCTTLDRRDTFADDLPLAVRDDILSTFGAALGEWLINPDSEILGKIDWTLYAAKCNGGASLFEIVHPRFRDAIPRALPALSAAA